MERWAGSNLGDLVNFLCVCVDPSAEHTAKTFVRELNLTKSIIGYCGSRKEFPTFPAQLGCGGLVIFDGSSRIVVPATQSLNQIGLPAFWNADNMLVAMVKEDDEEDEEDRLDRERRLYRDMDELRYDLVNGGARPCQIPGGPPAQKIQKEAVEGASASDKEANAPLGAVPSVGHSGMDHEHESCASLIRMVASDRSFPALEELLSELVQHFEHEEKLLKDTGFGSEAPEGMSPLTTHKQDHERIIKAVKGMIEKAKVEGVGEECGREIADLFENHAKEFDGRYTEYLATF
jgi:hemerythrin